MKANSDLYPIEDQADGDSKMDNNMSFGGQKNALIHIESERSAGLRAS